ncbi:MAG: hypothetical protein FJ291_04785 [Planctomycetes bacterium]|nr:hypothetical protein [Planctomycetota bacterium]
MARGSPLAAGLVLAALAGCVRPPLRPPEPVVLRPVERPATVWPTVLVDKVPGEFSPPWPAGSGGELELWQIDLLDLDRPDLTAWLSAWQPRRERLARPVPIQPAIRNQQSEIRLAISERGAYILRRRKGGETWLALVLASRIRTALTLNENDCEVLCADAQTGSPVRGAYVQLLYRTERLGRERVLTAAGSTDADGRWHTSLVRDRFAPSVSASAVACQGSDYAVATQERALEHSEAAYHLSLRPRSQTFRPGQSAELMGVLRTRSAGPRRLVPWADASLVLSLLDPAGRLAGAASARTDEAGSFNAAFALPRDAAPGPYAVFATVEGGLGGEPTTCRDAFSVAAPSPAPFRLRLTTGRAILAPDGKLELNLHAERADGSPIPNAPVRILSWGYPVDLDGAPRWVSGTEPVDSSRLVVLPIELPTVTTLDGNGRLALHWQTSLRRPADADLLCGVKVEVHVPELGAVERTAEFVLLRRAPPVAIRLARGESRFFRPGERIELAIASALPPDVQAKTAAVCTVAHEDRFGVTHTSEVVRAPIAWLVGQRLATTASAPGRYTFRVEAEGASSTLTVWVVDGEKDVQWGGALSPELVAERPWVRRGESVRAVAAAPGRDAPLAVTIRSGGSVARLTLPLQTGARAFRVQAGPLDEDPLEVSLVQIARGQGRAGRALLGIEPGGRALEVQSRLLWERQGEWSGRGYAIATRDRTGQPAQSVVHLELVRPAFQGSPPAGIERRTLHWHPGKATSDAGEIEVGFHESLLESACSLRVEAFDSRGRSGTLLMPLRAPASTANLKPGQGASPASLLAALVEHGLDTSLARWLAARLVASHPELADGLPALVAGAKADEEAAALVGLATASPPAARAALEAALKRGAGAAAALALAEGIAAELRPLFERTLASAPNPLVRAAAARALARALPASRDALVDALACDDEPAVRVAAVAALGQGGGAALPTLADAAKHDPSSTVRIAAVGALQQVGGADAAAVLLSLASDAAADVATEAVRALAEVGYCGADERLFRVLAGGSPDARLAAARLVARADGQDVAAKAVAALRRSPTGPLLLALAPLRSPPVQAAMARWLTHADPDVRLAAAEHLATLHDERTAPALRKFLEPGVSDPVADRAAAALIELRDTAAMPRLLTLLESGRLSHGTACALVGLAGKLNLPEAGPALLAILWRGLAEPNALGQAEARQAWAAALDAAVAISGTGGSPLPATGAPEATGKMPVPPQDARATEPIPAASPYAAALAALRSRGLAAFLAELWRSPLPDELRRATVLPFARVAGASGVARLIELLESPALHGPAVQALAQAGAAESLTAALRSQSAPTRCGAAAALGAAGDARAAASLQPLLADADPFVRSEAAHALAALTRQAVAYTDCLGERREASP